MFNRLEVDQQRNGTWVLCCNQKEWIRIVAELLEADKFFPGTTEATDLAHYIVSCFHNTGRDENWTMIEMSREQMNLVLEVNHALSSEYFSSLS